MTARSVRGKASEGVSRGPGGPPHAGQTRNEWHCADSLLPDFTL